MRIWMFIYTVLCLQTVEAQRLYSEVGDIYEKSKRTVVDNAKLGAFYKLKFRTDSTKLNDYTEAQKMCIRDSSSHAWHLWRSRHERD